MTGTGVDSLDGNAPGGRTITLRLEIPRRVVWAAKDRQQVALLDRPHEDVPPVERYAIDALGWDWDTERMI